jgi:hypothetical protein
MTWFGFVRHINLHVTPSACRVRHGCKGPAKLLLVQIVCMGVGVFQCVCLHVCAIAGGITRWFLSCALQGPELRERNICCWTKSLVSAVARFC